jgi:hypothetical protein
MCTQRLLRRLGLPAFAAAVLLAAAGEAARADLKPPQCSDDADSCEVVVEDPGIPGGSDGETTGEDDASDDGSGGETGAGDSGLTDCTSTIVDTDADSHPLAGPRPSGRPHVLVVETCTTPSGSTVQTGEWLELGANGQVQIRPEVLAQQAIDRLDLPQPQIAASPEEYQLVRLPTWLWLEGDSWAVQSASASVPGLTVTATATPVKAVWDLGDGTTVECDAGTPWTTEYDAKDASPDCGHTYTRSSAHVPGGEYEVSVVVEWAVSWSGGGETGTEPGMTTTADVTWQVAESQATVQ